MLKQSSIVWATQTFNVWTLMPEPYTAFRQWKLGLARDLLLEQVQVVKKVIEKKNLIILSRVES